MLETMLNVDDEDDNAVKVFGWDYCDDKYIWPNNNTLFITNYTKTVTLQSDGAALKVFNEAMGTNEMIPGLINMRPAWKHTAGSVLLFYSGDFLWTFLKFPIIDQIEIHSKTHGELLLPSKNWEIKADDYSINSILEDITLKLLNGEIEDPDQVLTNISTEM